MYHLYSALNDDPEALSLRQKLGEHLSSEAKLFVAECTAFVDTGITYRLFPDLVALQDKDGLIPLSKLAPIGPGVFKVGEFTVFAHHYFRRNLFRLNTLNYQFLDQLQNLISSQFIPRIALDPDMVGLASTYTGGRMELEYWWGPKFDDKLETIPVGVTRHDADENDKFFHGVSRTEFRWGSRANEHIFEAEELRDLPTKSGASERFGCRYVHSIVNEIDGKIDHLDGSIRMYSELEMIERFDLDIAHAPRKTEYTKLWRLDAPIEVSVWKSLISNYYRDNFLVGEYLGAQKLDKTIWKPETTKAPLDRQYVPYSLCPEDGLRVAVTFMPSRDPHTSTGQCIIANDFIGDEKQNSPYVEFDAIEIKKALKRLGLDLEIDDSIQFISFRDKYLNLPVVYLSEGNLTERLETILKVFETLFKSWSNNESKQVISITLRYPVDETRDVQISVVGWVTELLKWLKNPLSHPPTNAHDWYDWADKLSKFLQKKYHSNIDRFPNLGLLQSSGILLFMRERIEYDEIQWDRDDQGIAYKFKFSDSMLPIVNNLISQNITPGFAWLIVDGRCSNCGNSYFQCNCSKALDEGVHIIIEKTLPAFPFWTDKPAPIVVNK